MKLMTDLVFSLPAKAIYIDGGIDCYPNSVNGQAETILDFWDVWDGWGAASVSLQITGPSISASGIGYDWGPNYAASATASIGTPAPGTYQYNAWHYSYNSNWNNWEYLAYANTSCSVQGSGGGGNDPTPVISSMNPETWNAGQGYSLSIYGSGFGTAPELDISNPYVSYYITNGSDTYISAQVSVSPNAPDGEAQVQVISHGYNGMGFQGPPGGQGPGSGLSTAVVRAIANVLSFNVYYRAHIPVYHVLGPTPCIYQLAGVQPIYVPKIYKGDGSSSTYRQMESLQITPAWQIHSTFQRATGETRNYGYGSPANGSTLSSADEDSGGDCYRFNESGQASASALSFGANYPSSTQATVHFFGGAADPLEFASPTIDTDLQVAINIANPQNPTAQVGFAHDCYPAFQVVVNGQTVYSFMPSDNSLLHIGLCLAGVHPQITGNTAQVTVPVN